MSEFESFDYTKVTVAENQMSQYMDGYEHFGWKVDFNVPIEKGMGKVTIHLKPVSYTHLTLPTILRV